MNCEPTGFVWYDRTALLRQSKISDYYHNHPLGRGGEEYNNTIKIDFPMNCLALLTWHICEKQDLWQWHIDKCLTAGSLEHGGERDPRSVCQILWHKHSQHGQQDAELRRDAHSQLLKAGMVPLQHLVSWWPTKYSSGNCLRKPRDMTKQVRYSRL